MKPHPIAEIFPDIDGAEFDALVEDISEHGCIQPLVMYQGKILDGRNRWRACQKLGVKPKTTDYRGNDPVGYVLSLNLTRRHLTTSQRAMVAAKIANLGDGQTKAGAQICAPQTPVVSQADAAAKMKVSRRAVQQARQVREKADKPLVRAFEREGWIYDGRVTIDKDPQAQAIRTKSKALLFVQLEKDSSWSRPAMADYIVRFRAPGENPERIKPDLTREEWILWARPIWQDIDESDTLNTALAREEKDERHICPLQLGTIERCVRLWSNAGDTILSPFAGIGSEGVVALQQNRKFIGIELKESYFKTALRNLGNAKKQTTIFDRLTQP